MSSIHRSMAPPSGPTAATGEAPTPLAAQGAGVARTDSAASLASTTSDASTASTIHIDTTGTPAATAASAGTSWTTWFSPTAYKTAWTDRLGRMATWLAAWAVYLQPNQVSAGETRLRITGDNAQVISATPLRSWVTRLLGVRQLDLRGGNITVPQPDVPTDLGWLAWGAYQVQRLGTAVANRLLASAQGLITVPPGLPQVDMALSEAVVHATPDGTIGAARTAETHRFGRVVAAPGCVAASYDTKLPTPALDVVRRFKPTNVAQGERLPSNEDTLAEILQPFLVGSSLHATSRGVAGKHEIRGIFHRDIGVRIAPGTNLSVDVNVSDDPNPAIRGGVARLDKPARIRLLPAPGWRGWLLAWLPWLVPADLEAIRMDPDGRWHFEGRVKLFGIIPICGLSRLPHSDTVQMNTQVSRLCAGHLWAANADGRPHEGSSKWAVFDMLQRLVEPLAVRVTPPSSDCEPMQWNYDMPAAVRPYVGRQVLVHRSPVDVTLRFDAVPGDADRRGAVLHVSASQKSILQRIDARGTSHQAPLALELNGAVQWDTAAEANTAVVGTLGVHTRSPSGEAQRFDVTANYTDEDDMVQLAAMPYGLRRDSDDPDSAPHLYAAAALQITAPTHRGGSTQFEPAMAYFSTGNKTRLGDYTLPRSEFVAPAIDAAYLRDQGPAKKDGSDLIKEVAAGGSRRVAPRRSAMPDWQELPADDSKSIGGIPMQFYKGKHVHRKGRHVIHNGRLLRDEKGNFVIGEDKVVKEADKHAFKQAGPHASTAAAALAAMLITDAGKCFNATALYNRPNHDLVGMIERDLIGAGLTPQRIPLMQLAGNGLGASSRQGLWAAMQRGIPANMSLHALREAIERGGPAVASFKAESSRLGLVIIDSVTDEEVFIRDAKTGAAHVVDARLVGREMPKLAACVQVQELAPPP